MNLKTIFGPVLSGRLGLSLGVEVIPSKFCSFDCIYCECGKTNHLTLTRKEYVLVSRILSDLETYFASGCSDIDKIDVITITGAGEPALNSRLLDIIHGIRKLTSKPIALLTNASHIHLKEIRREYADVDILVPSLDSVLESSFNKIDKPHSDIKLEQIIQGLIDFKLEYSEVPMWLEILMLHGMNDSEEDIQALEKVIKKINPDRVHVGTLTRPGAYDGCIAIDTESLKLIQERLGAIAYRKAGEFDTFIMKPFNLLSTLKRRPMTFAELTKISGMSDEDLKLELRQLVYHKKIKKISLNQEQFYSAVINRN